MKPNNASNGLKQLESRLFRAHFDDGLLDLLGGIATLGIGILWIADLITLGPVIPILATLAWKPLHKTYVEPRSGYVEFSDTRTRQNKRTGWGGVGLGIGILALTLALSASGQMPRESLAATLASAIPAFLIAVMIALAAGAFRLYRFFGYAAIFVLAGLLGAFLRLTPGPAILAGATVVTLVGTARFARFLTLPVQDEEPGA